MQKETSYKKTLHGVQFKEETVRTTPEDGLVPEKILKPAEHTPQVRGKFHMGYATSKTYTTSDPRVVRPVIYGICGVFFAVGLLMLLLRHWVFAVVFLFVSITAFVKVKQQIDQMAERMEKQGFDVTIDSEEEKEAIRQEVEDTLKTALKESAKENITEERVKWLTKVTLPIYAVLCLAVGIFLAAAVHVALGVAALLICTVIGAVYYFVFLKWIARISQK